MDVFINAVSENIVEIVSLVSAGAIAIVSAIQSRKSQLETNSLTEKLNQINVDANLKASARIEWIQNVRNTTSKVLSAYYAILRSLSDEDLPDLFKDAYEQTQLLMLYFGCDKVENVDIELMSKDTNQGKNELIIDLLEGMQNKTDLFVCGRINNQIERDQQKIEEFLELSQGNETNYSDQIDKLREEILLLNNLPNQIKSDAKKLREAISLYLKIEWDIAKNGN